MRFLTLVAISVCFPQFASANPVNPVKPRSQALTFEVTLVDELGVETQTLSLPAGNPPRIMDMVGGFLEIAPAKSASAPSALSFYLTSRGTPVVAHSANIVASGGKPIQVAYLVCGAAVTYYSPRPAKLPKCVSSGMAARQP